MFTKMYKIKNLQILQETKEQPKKKLTKHQMDPGTQTYIAWTIIYNRQTKSKFRINLAKSDIQHNTNF